MRTEPALREQRPQPGPSRAARRRDSAGGQHRVLVTISIIVLPVLGLGIAVAAWWGYAVAFDVSSVLLPKPPEVVEALIEKWPELVEHGRVTVTQAMTGFGLAVVSGLVIGTVIAHSRIIDRMTYPWLVAFNSIPKVAVAPLLLTWMGFGMGPKIVMALLICFFPVVLSTISGLRTTPAELAELARSLDASRLQMFVKVRFPHALPQIFVGLKVALPLAMIGAVIAEFAGSSTGLGYVIKQASIDKAIAFAALAVLSVVSVALFYSLVALERMLLPWVKSTSG